MVRGALDILREKKLLKTENNIDINNERYNEEFEQYFNKEAAVEDLLGCYLPDERKIIIFTEMCRLVAKQLGLSFNTLKRVVLYHEAAHAVTHLGKDKKKNFWSCFNAADSKDKELFAQAYPFVFFRDEKMTRELKTFLKLAQHQSAKYNQWLMYIPLSKGALNKDLLKVRNSNWSISLVTTNPCWSSIKRTSRTVSSDGQIILDDVTVDITVSSDELLRIISYIKESGLLDIVLFFELIRPNFYNYSDHFVLD